MDAGTMYANAKALHELLQEERAENAKLRHDLEEANNQAEEVCIENAKLRELCSELLHMAESHDPEWLHWPELHDELRKLGVEVVKL